MSHVKSHAWAVVSVLTVHRRATRGKVPWCAFGCHIHRMRVFVVREMPIVYEGKAASGKAYPSSG